jgi:cobalt-zinc-cadmium efflux system membrane fusion protein
MKNIILIILYALGIIGCQNNGNEDHADIQDSIENMTTVELESEQIETVGIQIGELVKRNLKTAVKANGFLELPPQNKASISSIYGGIIEAINIRQGQFVQKGAVLAELKSPDFIKKQQDYIETLNRFTFLESEFERKKKLLDNDAASLKEFQMLEMDYKNMKSQLSALKTELKFYSINPDKITDGKILSSFPLIAPIQGYIGLINTNIGAFAEPQKELFEIFDTRFIHVDLLVYENDLLKVKENQLIQFSLNNSPQLTYEANIFSVEKSYEKDMNAVRVHASLKNPDQTLIPGMYVNARIIVDAYKAFSIPENSIIIEGDKSFIYMVMETKTEGDIEKTIFKKIQVITGAIDNGFEEVKPIEKLSEDAQIVIKGAYFVNAELIKQSGGQDD